MNKFFNIRTNLIITIFPGCQKDKSSVADYSVIRLDSAKKVGLAYTTWHQPIWSGNYWGTPELGQYASNNRSIIRQHGEWLAYAGVDFVFIDFYEDRRSGR